MIVSYTLFTPSEATELTGASIEQVRGWRRRGILPEVNGHARYDLFDLCELRALTAISETGMNPKEWLQQNSAIASAMLFGIAGAAIHGDAAYDFMQVAGILRQDMLNRRHNQNLNHQDVFDGGPNDFGSVAFFYPDGSSRIGHPKQAFDYFDGVGDSRLDGAIIMMNVEGMGQNIFQKAPRPLWQTAEQSFPPGGLQNE